MEPSTRRCVQCRRIEYTSDPFNEQGLCEVCSPRPENERASQLVQAILKAGEHPEPHFSRAEYVMAVRFLYRMLNPGL